MSRQNRRNYPRFQENNSFNRNWRGGRGYRPNIQHYYDNNYINVFFDNGYNNNYCNNNNNNKFFKNYKYDNKHGSNYHNRFRYGYNKNNYNKFDKFDRSRKFIEIDLGETKNEIDEKIKNELESLGYYVVEVKGDGNCLFRSVSEQIEGDENNYKQYRERCVDYIIQNKDDFVPFLDEDEPFDNYIEKISRDGEWGGNLELYALSMALEANFCIYIYNQPCYVIKNWETPKYNIFLSYHNGKHFNSFRKSNKKETEKKEEKEETDKKEEKEETDKKEEKEETDKKEEKIETVKKEEKIEKEEKEEKIEKEEKEDKKQNETLVKYEENKSKTEEIKENSKENPIEKIEEKSNEEKKEDIIENNESNKEEKISDDIDEFLSKVRHLNI